MNIDSIKNGIVIDHITAGRGMELYSLLGLDKLDCSIALIKNVHSNKMGKKDIIKIDSDISLDMKILGYVDPGVTVDIIDSYSNEDSYVGVIAGINKGLIYNCSVSDFSLEKSFLTFSKSSGANAIALSTAV